MGKDPFPHSHAQLRRCHPHQSATSMVRTKSFESNLFVSVGTIFILFALCFVVYQYDREKEYKIDIMQSVLQTNNYEILHSLGDSIVSSDKLRRFVHTNDSNGIRITIVDTHGKVIADSENDNVGSMENHLQRKEIRLALAQGSGYDLKRESKTTNDTYFYSATKFTTTGANGRHTYIIRSAVPYSATLTESLEADYTYLYFTVILTVLLGFVLYSNTKRVSRHIGYLRQFALKAERGEEFDKQLEQRVPDDELGDISHTIIKLYWKLRNSEEDKQRIKRQLTQNAAHELKTPAASIQGYLETMINTPDLPEDKRRHFLERCYQQSERMCRLLQDMSTLTKLDAVADKEADGKPKSTVDVKAVIASVLDDTALELSNRGITTTLNLPDEVVIPGDYGLVYSIFRNLIDNSIAYATGATRISIICAESEGEEPDKDGRKETKGYDFTVSDNGCGVAPEHLGHIFERFYRVDKGRSRKIGGTGLGMAIVKNAVAVHGGTTSAEITPGGGLTVKFSLRA
jgi:signal transduction histidine kinase